MKRIISSLFFLIALAVVSSAQYFNTNTAAVAGTKLRNGDREGAIAILTKAIEERKDLFEAYLMRGNIRSMGGDIDGAIADYSAALEINPADGETYEKRALYRTFKRDYAGALKDLDSAIANSKYPERILVRRGRLNADMGNSEAAASDYQTALSHNPRLASAVIGLAELREKSGDLDAAILTLKDFLDAFEGRHEGKQPTVNAGLTGELTQVKREPKDDKSQEYLVSTGVVNKRTPGTTREDAEKQTIQMEQMLNVSHAYMTIGRYYIAKDQNDKALENIEKGLKMNPEDPFGYSLRSQIRWKQNDLRGVIADMTKVVNSPLKSPGIHLDRAILLTLEGKDDAAAAEFAIHRKTFPAFTDEQLARTIERAKQLRGDKVPK